MSLSPGLCAQIACVLEVSAPKAGNVHRERDFADTTYLDFLLSAAAIAPALELAGARGVGETVLDAIERTQQVVSTNTNLGIVLLLAPLAAVHHERELRPALQRLLATTTVHDAELVYRAIRLAAPGALGNAPREDVQDAPTVPLLETMELAADRDLVGRQYASGFEDVFETGLPALADAVQRGLSVDDTVVSCHLTFLAGLPDSLIQRKAGDAPSRKASRLAAGVLEAGWPDQEAGVHRLDELDRWLRSEENRLNPGATADLTAASLFVALRAGILPIPFSTRR